MITASLFVEVQVATVGNGLFFLYVDNEYGHVADVTAGEFVVPAFYQFFHL